MTGWNDVVVAVTFCDVGDDHLLFVVVIACNFECHRSDLVPEQSAKKEIHKYGILVKGRGKRQNAVKFLILFAFWSVTTISKCVLCHASLLPEFRFMIRRVDI